MFSVFRLVVIECWQFLISINPLHDKGSFGDAPMGGHSQAIRHHNTPLLTYNISGPIQLPSITFMQYFFLLQKNVFFKKKTIKLGQGILWHSLTSTHRTDQVARLVICLTHRAYCPEMLVLGHN